MSVTTAAPTVRFWEEAAGVIQYCQVIVELLEMSIWKSMTIILPFISFKLLFVIPICDMLNLQLHISGS